MWNELSAKRVARPMLAEVDWEDLFAYLYSVQVFQFPAETRRGQDVFSARKCGECHSVTKHGPGKPISAWKPVEDPATLVYKMWNHASSMKKVFDARKKDWSKLDGRDFVDLSGYIQYVQKRVPQHCLSSPEATSGRAAFEHNCQQCHQGPLALETRLANKTFVDIGAGVWNHIPLMGPFPNTSEADMRKILAYVWDRQVQGPKGNVMGTEWVPR